MLASMDVVSTTMRVSAEGYWFKTGNKELGPFTVKNEQEKPGGRVEFDQWLAKELAVSPEEIGVARTVCLNRPISLDELGDILSTTICHDDATKKITFLVCVNTYTEQDQANIIMAGEASGGKSYIALEIASYFEGSVLPIATSSPAAFIHDQGEWDAELRVIRMNLRGKIIILLDQPHYMLLQRLRSLMSHDRRELLFKITDRSKSGAHRTKNVLVIGFPTWIFCSAKIDLEDQELTRSFLLSPETSQEKLDESLQLLAAKVGNRAAFTAWINNHPQRRWLKERVQNIRNAMIRDVIIENEAEIYKRFLSQHPRLAPRHQRDLPRIFALIKAHALLNFAHRNRPEGNDRAIIAVKEDEEAAFQLYGQIAESNELGLPPEVHQIYIEVLKPLLKEKQLVTRQQVLNAYYQHFGRFLNEQRLRKEILQALEAKGLIVQEPDPSDKRRTLLSLPETIGTASVYTSSIEPPRITDPAIVSCSTTLKGLSNNAGQERPGTSTSITDQSNTSLLPLHTDIKPIVSSEKPAASVTQRDPVPILGITPTHAHIGMIAQVCADCGALVAKGHELLHAQEFCPGIKVKPPKGETNQIK